MLKLYHEKILWFEEPGDPLDYNLQSNLSNYMKLTNNNIPIATGENLFSSIDSKNLLLYGGLNKKYDILQFDCSLS